MKTCKYILFLFILFSHSIFSQWFLRNSGTTNNLRGVCYIDPLHISIVGDLGTILRSSDGGTSWFLQSSGVTDHLYAIAFTDEYFGIAVGTNGTILKTNDGGTNWVLKNSGTTVNLYSISCPDSDNCIAVGLNGTILKSTDGGNNWIQLSSGTTSSLYDLSFTDLNNGFVVGMLTLLKTTNGGTNWMSLASNYILKGISCVDSNICTAVGIGGSIVKTTNGGNTWLFQPSGTFNSLNSISISDSLNGHIIGAIGTILGTMDGGVNWSSQLSWTNKDLYGISFLSADTGIAVGANGVIRITNSGGVPVEFTSFTATAKDGMVELSWSTATETNNHLFEIERRNEYTDFRTIGFVKGAGTTAELNKYFFIDKNVEKGINFYRLKQIDYNGTFEYSDEVEFLATGPLSFRLEQNYPNPFNPVTSIKYVVSSQQFCDT